MEELTNLEIIKLFRDYGKEPNFIKFLTNVLPKLRGNK